MGEHPVQGVIKLHVQKLEGTRSALFDADFAFLTSMSVSTLVVVVHGTVITSVPGEIVLKPVYFVAEGPIETVEVRKHGFRDRRLRPGKDVWH